MLSVMKRKLAPQESDLGNVIQPAATIAGTVIGAVNGNPMAGYSIGSGVGKAAKGALNQDAGGGVDGAMTGLSGAAGVSGAKEAAPPLFGQSDDTLGALRRRLMMGFKGRGEL